MEKEKDRDLRSVRDIMEIAGQFTEMEDGAEWWEERGYDPDALLEIGERSMQAAMIGGSGFLRPSPVSAALIGNLMIGYALAERDFKLRSETQD